MKALFGSAQCCTKESAEWWRSSTTDIADEYARARAEAVLLNSYEQYPALASDKKHTFDLAIFMLRYYMDEAPLAGGFWAAGQAGWEPIAIEERIIIDLGDIKLSFQLDRLVRLPSHDLTVLVDLKTAGRMNKNWERNWPLSLQQKLYRWAVREHYSLDLSGHYIEGLLKDVPCDLKYVELPDWSDAELAEAVELFKTLWQRDATLIRSCSTINAETMTYEVDIAKLTEVGLTETTTNPFDCYSYYTQCPMYDICQAPPNQRVALLEESFEWVEPLYLA